MFDGNLRLVCFYFFGVFWKYVLYDCFLKSYFWLKGKLEKEVLYLFFCNLLVIIWNWDLKYVCVMICYR